MSLFQAGLLQDGEGRLSDDVRNKILDAFGYGTFENARDITHLHIRKAERGEHRPARTGVRARRLRRPRPVHVTEHTRALLSGGEGDEAVKARLSAHIAAHRALQEQGK